MICTSQWLSFAADIILKILASWIIDGKKTRKAFPVRAGLVPGVLLGIEMDRAAARARVAVLLRWNISVKKD